MTTMRARSVPIAIWIVGFCAFGLAAPPVAMAGNPASDAIAENAPVRTSWETDDGCTSNAEPTPGSRGRSWTIVVETYRRTAVLFSVRISGMGAEPSVVAERTILEAIAF